MSIALPPSIQHFERLRDVPPGVNGYWARRNGGVEFVPETEGPGSLWTLGGPSLLGDDSLELNRSLEAINPLQGFFLVDPGAAAELVRATAIVGNVPTLTSNLLRGHSAGARVFHKEGVVNIDWFRTDPDEIGDAVQRAHDANPMSMLQFGMATDLRVKKPMFMDLDTDASRHHATVIDGMGTRITLDPSLPTIGTFTPDTLTKGWCFPNTKRSAWNTGTNVVNASIANQARPGGGKLKPMLILVNFIFDCSELDPLHSAGIMFGNGIGTAMVNCRFISQRFGLSWTDYTDKHALLHCSAIAPLAHAVGSYGIWQIDNGDNVQWIGNHGRGCCYRGERCHGLTLIGGVGNQQFVDRCVFTSDDLHTESDQVPGATDSAFNILNGIGKVQGGQLNPPHVGNVAGVKAAIYVDDSPNLSYGGASSVEVNGVLFKHSYRDETDPKFLPDVAFGWLNPDAHFRMRDCTAIYDVSGQTAAGPVIGVDSAGDPALVTALRQGYALLGSGNVEVWQRRGQWTVTPLGRGAKKVQPKVQASGLSAANSTVVVGTIVAGRRYCVAPLDEAGNYGLVSAVVTAGVPAGGSNRLRFSCQELCQVVVWYSEEPNDVLAAPAGYAVLNWPGISLGQVWDGGDALGGVAWIRSSVPVPNVVAAVDHTISGIQLDNGTIQLDATGALVKRTEYLADLALVAPSPGSYDMGVVQELSQDSTIGAPSLGGGTAGGGRTYELWIRSTSATPRALAWNAAYKGSPTQPLPTTTSGNGKWDILVFVYNPVAGLWTLGGATYGA